MTHAQIGMNESIQRKWIGDKPSPSYANFKLKRFVDNISPKTSTKRGDNKFYIQ